MRQDIMTMTNKTREVMILDPESENGGQVHNVIHGIDYIRISQNLEPIDYIRLSGKEICNVVVGVIIYHIHEMYCEGKLLYFATRNTKESMRSIIFELMKGYRDNSNRFDDDET